MSVTAVNHKFSKQRRSVFRSLVFASTQKDLTFKTAILETMQLAIRSLITVHMHMRITSHGCEKQNNISF